MVGEFIDEPGSNPADVGGKPGAPSEGVGIRMVAEFVDQAPDGEPPPHQDSRLPPDPEASASATTLYDRALTLYEQLVRQEGRSDLASDLARAYANKAIAVRELGAQRAAVALTDQTIALYERLVQQEGRQALTPDLATAYLNKAAAVRALGDGRSAVTLCDRAITLYESLIQQEGRNELRGAMARAQDQRAHSLLALELTKELPTVTKDLPEGTAVPITRAPLVIDETTSPFATIRLLLDQSGCTRWGWLMSSTAIVARPHAVRPMRTAPNHSKWR